MEPFIQVRPPQSNNPPLGTSTGLAPLHTLETEGSSWDKLHYDSQFSLPALDPVEKWDLEGFFQLIYSLAAVSLPPSDPALWETYSPLLVKAFFKAADDEDQLFTDNELITAFKNCSEAFVTFYNWPKHTKAGAFTNHTSGKDALDGVLQLIKLAKSFGAEGEEWWELRRNVRIAFAESFQRHGWVSTGSDIFHRLFTLSLQVFLDLGIKPGTWTHTIIGDLAAWRKVKETQEAIAAERAILALEKRVVVESAWETLRRAINGGISNSSPYPSPMCSQNIPDLENPEGDSTSKMSPGSRLREHERMKPILNLQQRLAPSPPHPSLQISPARQPITPTPTPSRAYSYSDSSPSYAGFGNICPGKQDQVLSTSTSPRALFMTSQGQYFPSLEEESEPGFGDLPDLGFGDFMDLDPCDWNGDSGIFSNTDGEDDEGFESQQAEAMKSYKERHDKIVDDALQWSGKQLWEMSDEEFQEFCSRPPRWQ